MAQKTAEMKLALLRRHDDGVPWTRITADSGVPVRTLTRWASRYRADPSSRALERPRRGDRGIRRIAPGLVEVVEALALRRPEPTAAFIHRRVCDIAHDRALAAPSYTTVRTIIAGLDPGLRTLAQHGDAAYRDRFELVFRRNASRSNEQWQVDHTLLDVAVLDKTGISVRPWLTIVLDDYSRGIAGYTVFIGAPTAEQTALALHQAVNRKANSGWPVCGLPDVLYSDHGSDFTSARLERVCLDTHIQLIHSRVGVPQGRGKIERFYGTVTTELLPHLPGHIPHGTNGTFITPPALTLRQLDEILERFIVDDYNHRPHSETHEAPSMRWAASGFIPRSPAHPEDLDLLLLTYCGGNQESPTRRHPVRLHPVRLNRPRRLRRGAGDRPLQPTRRRRDPRLLRRRLPLPSHRPRTRIRVRLVIGAARCPRQAAAGAKTAAPAAAEPCRRSPRRHPLPAHRHRGGRSRRG